MSAVPRVAILEKQGGVLSWHHDLEEGFRSVGAQVVSLQLRPSGWADYLAKWRTGLPALQNRSVIARVAGQLRSARPDLVVLLKQPGLPAAALEAWRSAAPRAPFVAWICDHLPAWPTSLVAGLDGVCYFDSATRPILEKAYAGGNARLIHLPLAANPARYQAREIPFTRRRPALVFAGRNTSGRKLQLGDYRSRGGRVDAFGPGADSGWRIWRRKRLEATSLSDLYAAYFGVLNLLQPPNTVHGLNLRAFEAPAAGALATYPLVPDLAPLFVPGEEVVAYRDLADLKTQIDHLLATPARAAAIAAAGRARVLREHTFEHRAARLLADWLG